MSQMTIASFISHVRRMAAYAEKAADKAGDPLEHDMYAEIASRATALKDLMMIAEERGVLPTERPF